MKSFLPNLLIIIKFDNCHHCQDTELPLVVNFQTKGAATFSDALRQIKEAVDALQQLQTTKQSRNLIPAKISSACHSHVCTYMFSKENIFLQQ